MNDVISLTKRNIKIFLRDKTAVFFSFFSLIIFIFIFSIISNTFKSDSLQGMMSENELTFLVNSIMIGGILVLNTSNLALGNLGSIVNDFDNHAMESFLVTPIKRQRIVFAYCIASFIITSVFSLLFWFLAIIIFGIMSQIFYSFEVIVVVSLLIMLYVFISVSFMLLLTTFIKSINAFGAVAGVFGTLIGFLSGIYIPLSVLPKFFANIASFVPYAHLTILIKQILLKQSLTNINFDQLSEAEARSIRVGFGIEELSILGYHVPMYLIVIATVILALAALVFATKRLQKRINN